MSAIFQPGAGVFGSEQFYVDSDGNSANATTALADKATMTKTVAGGTYNVEWSAEVTIDILTSRPRVVLIVDGVTYDDVAYGITTAGEFIVAAGVKQVVLAAGARNAKVQFAKAVAGAGTETVTIRNTRIEIVRAA